MSEGVTLLHLQFAEELRQPTGDRVQELPSGALRDEVDVNNPIHGVGGTGYGMRRSLREAPKRPRKIDLLSCARSIKRDVIECENEKQKCKNVNQDNYF